MARSLWSGTLSFGLVSIPVSIVSAKEEESVSFNLLDQRDYGRIGYRTYNKSTGQEVPRERIVKGYEYEPDQFVIITERDMERANPRATRTIDLEDFVNQSDVDPLYFEKPYYLIPAKHGEKGYQLLRKVLQETKKVAIGRFVFRQRQKLVAILPRGEYLVLEMLRFAREVLSADERSALDETRTEVRVTPRELQMAEALVKEMSTKWKPEKYKDTYHTDVMKMIEDKVRRGSTVESEEIPVEEAVPRGKVVDLLPLLRRSLEAEGKKGLAKGETLSRGLKVSRSKVRSSKPAAKNAKKKNPRSPSAAARTRARKSHGTANVSR